MELLKYLLIALLLNVLVFIVAYIKNSDKYTDITYATTFITILIMSHISTSKHELVHLLSFVLVLLWALRLGGFLLFRINKMGKDTRFNNIRGNFGKFASFFILQATIAWIVSFPTIVLVNQNSQFNYFSIIFGTLAFISLLFESIADIQKYRYKAAGNNDLIKTGLYQHCRYPNYFGEISFWLMYSFLIIFSLPNISPISIIISLASPLTIFIVIRFVSGIAILEKSRDLKFKDDKSYWEYKTKTNMLLPFKKKK